MKRRESDMTFGNSFLTNMRLQFRRRLWNIVLSGLLLFLFLVIGSFLGLSAIENSNSYLLLPEALLLERKLQTLDFFLGFHSFNAIFSGLLAVVLSVSGFAYLDSRQELDFYESQPTSRRMRFVTVFLSGILIYASMSALWRAVAVLIAVALRAMTLHFLLQCVLQYFRELILFLGIYGISTLSMLLCGNILISLLGTAVLLFYEPWIRLLQLGCKTSFFRTYLSTPGEESWIFRSSPVYYYLSGISETSTQIELYRSVGMREFLRNGFRDMLRQDLQALLLFLIVLALCWIAYCFRKNEALGAAVVFRPMQIVIKFALTVPGALSIGLLVGQILGFHDSALSTGLILALTVFAAVLLCCMMEIIYNFRFRSLFRHPVELLTAVLLSLGILCFYRFDLAGYDRYVPKAEALQSVKFITSYWGDARWSLDEHGMEKGELPDEGEYAFTDPALLRTITELAQLGQEYSCKIPRDSYGYYSEQGYRVHVYYQMRDGSQRARQFLLPYDIDEERMNRITDTETYKESEWLLSGYPFEAGHGAYTELQYETAYSSARSGYGSMSSDTLEGNDEIAAEFLRAYTEDLKQFRYSFAIRNDFIGEVTLYVSPTPEDYYRYGDDEIEMPLGDYLRLSRENQKLPQYQFRYQIYPSYRNTLEFLKKHGLYLPEKPEASEVSKLTVWRSGGDDEEEVYQTSDTAEIGQLLALAVRSNVWGERFYNPENYEEDLYVRVTLKQDPQSDPGYDGGWEITAEYIYRKGQVPELLRSRLGIPD